MPIQDKDTLKSYFEDGSQPTQENFEDLIDSFILMNNISWNDVTGTPVTLQDMGSQMQYPWTERKP